MNRFSVLFLASFASAAVACSSSNSATSSDAGSTDAASSGDATTPGDSGPSDAGTPTGDGASGLTTIAAAIQGKVTTPITVQAIITAEHGSIPNDVSQWYIEDPAGGPYSGVIVYCDPDLTTKCPTIRAPARWTLVQMTGALTTYKGQTEFIPTEQTILSDAGTPPPIPTVAMSDVAPGGTSQYRGVLVKVAAGTTLTVDDVTPSALLDTECTTVIGPDGGALDSGSADAGDAGDAGQIGASDAGGGILSCATLCEPPAYSGFRANDGMGNEVNIEASFFATDPLQSSPECLTQPNVTPVVVGTAFTMMQGVLDYDPYASQQQISPVTPADYTIQ